jgi:DNA-binding transcriptional regulator YdaS (Cro superfamily)
MDKTKYNDGDGQDGVCPDDSTGQKRLVKFIATHFKGSQRAFSITSGVSEAQISRIISGKSTKLEPETIIKIEDATNGWISLRDWAPK